MDKKKLVEDPKYVHIVSTIDREVDYVDFKPFSHNIISLALGSAAKEFGDEVANDLIEEFELEDLGWQKKPTDKDEID